MFLRTVCIFFSWTKLASAWKGIITYYNFLIFFIAGVIKDNVGSYSFGFAIGGGLAVLTATVLEIALVVIHCRKHPAQQNAALPVYTD